MTAAPCQNNRMPSRFFGFLTFEIAEEKVPIAIRIDQYMTTGLALSFFRADDQLSKGTVTNHPTFKIAQIASVSMSPKRYGLVTVLIS